MNNNFKIKKLLTHFWNILTLVLTSSLAIFFTYSLYEMISSKTRIAGPVLFFSGVLLVSLFFLFWALNAANPAHRLLCVGALLLNLLLAYAYIKITFLGIWFLLLYLLFITLLIFIILIYSKWINSEPWVNWRHVFQGNPYSDDRHEPPFWFWAPILIAVVLFRIF